MNKNSNKIYFKIDQQLARHLYITQIPFPLYAVK